MKKNKKWFKVLVYKVKTEIFKDVEDMKLLWYEMLIFNKDLSLVTLSY